MKNSRESLFIFRYSGNYLILLFFILTIVFSACISEGDSDRKFWAVDVNVELTEDMDVEKALYQVQASVAAEGDYCKVWVEMGLNIDFGLIEKVVKEYDEKIRPRLLPVFSYSSLIKDPGTQRVVASNILDAADYLADGDGKLSILILDLSRGRNSNSNYDTAGYFWANNFYANKYSNKCDMIYMNSRYINRDIFFTTLAHETQHLMNFVTSYFQRAVVSDNTIYINDMDTWIDEGLSAAAEWVYSGEHTQERIDWYNGSYNEVTNEWEPNGLIAWGNNFFVWGESPEYILDEYSTVYLFFQWIRLQTGGSDAIYKKIIGSTHWDYQAVTKAVGNKGSYVGENPDWPILLKDWLAANYLTNPGFNNSKYSYMNDPVLSTISAWVLTTSFISTALFPGEGVYSETQSVNNIYNTYTSMSGPNIRHLWVGTKGSEEDDTVNTNTYGALITYNINTLDDFDEEKDNIRHTWEIGRIQPSVLSPALSAINDAESINVQKNTGLIVQSRLTKPHIIGMGDLLRMKGHKKYKDLGFGKFGLKKPIWINKDE